MTGDVVLNRKASCLVMTTEILRSLLLQKDEISKEISWVIFDEVHYIKDLERGVIWEETIILCNKQVRLLFLSATIPNTQEFAEWIVGLKQQPCHVIYNQRRPIPLKHYVFPNS